MIWEYQNLDLEDWRKSEPSTSFKEFLNKLVNKFKREKLVDLLEGNGPESTLIRIIIYHILSYHRLLPTLRKTSLGASVSNSDFDFEELLTWSFQHDFDWKGGT